MAGIIGIKIANGDFYPLTEENLPAKKKLILTTVHDRQASVQIDLFRSVSKTMLDAQYIGSMVVENIRPKPKGEPSIEMVISSDSDGNIIADAYNLDTNAGGEHHTLNVSLKTLDTPGWGSDDFPDFDFESDVPQSPVGLYERENLQDREERKFPWIIMGLSTLFVVLAISVLWFFFFGGRETLLSKYTGRSSGETAVFSSPSSVAVQPVTPQPVEPAISRPATPPAPPVQPSAPVPAPVEPVSPPPVIRAPVTPPPAPQTVRRQRPPAPVSSYRVPAVIPRNGVVYQIQWGDTLWDISAAFYRDPWLYPRIARYNNIKNPDMIISGFNVRIPPKE